MTTRDEHYIKFGHLRDEASDLVTLEEINRIREHLGLEPRTIQQMLDEMDNHVSSLEPYDWMEKE